jgi:hypothetical protein
MPVLPAQRVHRVAPARRVLQGLLGRQDLKVRKVPPVYKAPQGLRDLKGPLGRPA